MAAEVAVLVGFLLFCGLVVWMGVPKMIAGVLDSRAERISEQLEEARMAREDAQKLLASFERKHKEAQREADDIVKHAQTEARRAGEQAKADIKTSIARKLKSAEDRIASAEAAATREVRNAAAAAAIAAATEVIGKGVDDKRADAMINDGIKDIGARLN